MGVGGGLGSGGFREGGIERTGTVAARCPRPAEVVGLTGGRRWGSVCAANPACRRAPRHAAELIEAPSRVSVCLCLSVTHVRPLLLRPAVLLALIRALALSARFLTGATPAARQFPVLPTLSSPYLSLRLNEVPCSERRQDRVSSNNYEIAAFKGNFSPRCLARVQIWGLTPSACIRRRGNFLSLAARLCCVHRYFDSTHLHLCACAVERTPNWLHRRSSARARRTVGCARNCCRSFERRLLRLLPQQMF